MGYNRKRAANGHASHISRYGYAALSEPTAKPMKL